MSMYNYFHFIKELFLYKRKKVFLILFSCIITIISFIFFLRFLFLPFTGLILNKPEIRIKNNNIYFSPRFLYSPAINAGLRPDKDIILKINDNNITGVKQLIDILYHIKKYTPLSVEVLRDNFEKVRLKIKPELMLLRIDWIFTFILACILIIIGFIILIHLHDPGCYLFSISLFLYLLSICVRAFYYENFFSMILVHIGHISIFLLPVFSLYFPYHRFNKILRFLFIFFIIFYYFVYSGFSLFFYLQWVRTDSIHWFLNLSLLERIRKIAEIILILTFFILLLSSYIKSKIKKIKTQVQWIIAGFILALSPYFFFEHLPSIMETMIKEKVSLGNFADIFICIIPIFFLIGIYNHKREKYTYIIPQSIYYLISIPLFLFLFITIAHPFKSYLVVHFGFTESIAYLFLAFFYLLQIQPFIIIGMKIIEKKIYLKKFKNSLQYITSLKNENILLKQRNSSQLKNEIAHIYSNTLKDITKMMECIYTKTNKRLNIISKSVLVIKRKLERIFLLLREPYDFDEIDLQEKENDMYKEINNIIEGNIRIKELIRKINKYFYIKPSLPTWIGSDYIIKKTIFEINKSEPYFLINTEKITTSHFYCCPSDIIDALTHLVLYLINIIGNHENGIILKSYIHNACLIIEIECPNIGISQGMIKNMFIPYISDEISQKREIGPFLYKILIKKNSGSINTHYSERTIQFINTFPLEKNI